MSVIGQTALVTTSNCLTCNACTRSGMISILHRARDPTRTHTALIRPWSWSWCLLLDMPATATIIRQTWDTRPDQVQHEQEIKGSLSAQSRLLKCAIETPQAQ